MQNSRENSVWRTLAVAFGDGLAFGAGMNLTQKFDAQMAALREQMVTVPREFAETVSRLVEEQIEAGVRARLEPLEEKLRGTIREEAERASEVVAAELERRLEARDRNVLQL